MNDTVLERLVLALDGANAYDSNVLAPPVAILWTDEARQWESVIPALQRHRRIVRYGSFDADAGQGPAYWLRCVIAGTVELNAPSGTPIVYLPGVSRNEVRSLDAEAPELAPLGAIQHRCQWFSHANGKDWTIRALLSNADQGLGLDVAGDTSTASALVDSVHALLSESMSKLKTKHIDNAFLNSLLNPDPVRSLLLWLDDPATTRQNLSGPSWAAFAQQCRHDFGYDPDAAGELEGARRLGAAEGPWAQVWERFRQAPTDYPGVPDRLRQAQPAELLPSNPGAWPTMASEAEDQLRADLIALHDQAPQAARDKVLALDAEHKPRRGYVWADLGWTPLALAIEHLAEAARVTSSGVSGTDVGAIAEWYAADGWRADQAVLAALGEVDRKVDIDAVSAAINVLYRPWLDAAAKQMQVAVGPAANAGTYAASPAPKPKPGEVVMFIDGLRLDVAHHLADALTGAGLESVLATGLAALPTVTQTSKPALVPIDQALLVAGDALDARRAPDGPPAGAQVLRALMGSAQIQVLKADEPGDPSGIAWTEAGEIDHRAHDLGILVVHELDSEVQRITSRIRSLLDAGWSSVTVVTDHGWLLLPGGLPKCADLPVGATETKKGRCARVKDGADVSVPTVPWHWDSHVRIAVAPGISCFEANQTYEHGGVSPQECVVPRITVSQGAGPTTGAAIASLKWRGLTLSVEVADLPSGATVDLRATPGDAGSSIAKRAKMTGNHGKELLIIDDDDLEGQIAHLVVIGSDGSLLLQRETTVGQNR